MTQPEGVFEDCDPRRLRVLVVAEKDPFNSHLLYALVRVCDVQQVVTSAYPSTGSPRSRLGRLRTSPRAATRSARAAALRIVDRRLNRRITGMLANSEFWPEQAASIPDAELRGDGLKELIVQLRPDLLVLSGAPILPSHVFSIPRLGTVNLHLGLANRYRGNHCLLFPLLKGQHDAVGSTLHYVDEGIDTGPVIAQGRPTIDASDTMASAVAKTAEISAVMLTDFVEAAACSPVSGVRVERGVLVRHRDRRVWHHAYLALRHLTAVFRPRRLSHRTIVRHYGADERGSTYRKHLAG